MAKSVGYKGWRDNVLEWLTDRLRGRAIVNEEGGVYMERYHLLNIFGRSIYIHRINGPDIGPYSHNHPWAWCWAKVLAGEYVEVREHVNKRSRVTSYYRATFRRRGWRAGYKMGPDYYHRIVSVPSGVCWSLFIHGKRTNGWGYIRPNPKPDKDNWIMDLVLPTSTSKRDPTIPGREVKKWRRNL